MRVLLLFLFWGWATYAFGQLTYRGIVLDRESGEPLVGASLYELGTTNGTLIGVDGRFELISQTDSVVLVCTYPGYEKLSFTPGDPSAELTLRLKVLSTSLDQVVVTALGIKRQQPS